MKKLLLVTCFVLALSVVSISTKAEAWTYCVKDVLYPTQYQVDYNPVTGVINGGAYYPTPTDWYGPITGAIKGSTISFAIAYTGGGAGLRFYEVSVGSYIGRSWGVYSLDGTFYDLPRAATLTSCTVLAAPNSIDGSGASK